MSTTRTFNFVPMQSSNNKQLRNSSKIKRKQLSDFSNIMIVHSNNVEDNVLISVFNFERRNIQKMRRQMTQTYCTMTFKYTSSSCLVYDNFRALLQEQNDEQIIEFLMQTSFQKIINYS